MPPVVNCKPGGFPNAAIKTALVATVLGALGASACSEGESDETS
jgi:hypothetical protein